MLKKRNARTRRRKENPRILFGKGLGEWSGYLGNEDRSKAKVTAKVGVPARDGEQPGQMGGI